jgi:hypothetical protein
MNTDNHSNTEGTASDGAFEESVETDFTIPEDADFTTPGNPITNDKHLEEEEESLVHHHPEATPGDPIREEK